MCVRRTFLVKFHRIRGPFYLSKYKFRNLSSKDSSLVDVFWIKQMKFQISERFIDFDGTFRMEAS